MPDDKNLSGLDWFKKNQAKYPNSDKIADLDAAFRSKVQEFEKALKAAGAKISVSATRRNAQRAAVMHWGYKVAKGAVKGSAVPKIDGVDINFDHGDDKASQEAAKAMIGPQGFDVVYQPSLTSHHIAGKAIDWTISWSGTLKIKDKKGKEVVIDKTPRDGGNKTLHEVGASYGVKKLVSDPPHWSVDGK